MQKIVPHLWFDKEAKEASDFYVSAFGNALGGLHGESKVTNISVIHDTPTGDCDIVSFMLAGFEFMAISAGPLFRFNPSVSFLLNFDPGKDPNARERLDALWKVLSEGGQVLMPLQKYDFSEHYGWVQDKYGVSWQLMLTNPDGEERPFLVPSLLFVTEGCDKAEEATDFYLSVFKDGKRGLLARYPGGMEPNKEGAVMFTDVMLAGQWFAAMDGSADMHKFAFNEAISFIVRCETQEEIDYYWGKLSAVPESEQCGWLKDRYGVSWQIVPTALGEMMSKGTPEQIARVTQAFLKMKKFDIAALKKAYEG